MDSDSKAVMMRRKAEARMAELCEDQVESLPEDGQALIHELRTHQIELEMQNNELRQTEAELTEARDRYTDLYNHSPAGYLTLSSKLIIQQANLSLASMLDSDVLHLLSMPFSKFICQEDQDIYYRHHREVVTSGLQQTAELKLIRTDGSQFWARIETAPEQHGGDASGRLLLSVSDISQQKETELAVERERDRAESYLNMAGTMIVAMDRKQIVTLANREACEVLGYAKKDIIGKNWFDHFVPKENQPEVKRVFDQLIAGVVEPVECFENPVLSKHGKLHMIVWHNRLLQDHDGNITGTLSSGEDITERRAAEQRTFELIQAMEQTGEAILITDTSGTIEYVNKAFTITTGYSFDEAVGNTPRMLHSGRQDTAFYKAMWSDIREHSEWRGKIWNRRKNGEVYPEQLHINAIRDMQGNLTHYSGVFSDITEQLSLEQQLQQAQKMEAVGTLVGGIAHDFNNMLASITGNLYLMKSETRHLPTTSQRLEVIESQCFRASDMIAQLLAFARKGMVHMVAFDLSSFIKELCKINRVTIAENIKIRNEICSEKLLIHGDATQLQQIMMNLLNNARDAVANSEQPEITVSLKKFDVGADFLVRHPDVKGKQFACLSVSDNGMGIAKSNMAHLFEPFYTTKEVGKGTGLGLAMVYGAVQTHLGAIEIESRENEGASFRIYLPLHEDDAPVEVQTKISDDSAKGETILLVDDEATVRDATAEVLQSMGYKVITAKNGRQAVHIFEEQYKAIDLLILDVVMPDMGGLKAATRMRAICPDIPVIFSTGYDLKHIFAANDGLENTMVLNKPTPIAELSRNIRSMLSS
ncbi:PAS domain-containing sensor histidine kinase [Mariprofundus sp. EBB-1]|uniref:hybrid sensor histidine kinase/response regulator n=1 Tax=Mariprofundus sp. EBB-1 TaxID=2650971 RepID=UPI00137A32F4|nr:PAS domain-containing sensor histidine kinase [Mariprofundus sp. EBB-1]